MKSFDRELTLIILENNLEAVEIKTPNIYFLILLSTTLFRYVKVPLHI